MMAVSNNGIFWARLIQSNNNSLREFLLRRNQTDADVADIIQETYIRLVNIQPSSIDNPQAYIFKTATNLSINNHKKVQKYEHRIQNIPSKNKASSSHADSSTVCPELQLEAHRKRELMLDALRDLPQNCRTAFILHRFYPDTYVDISKKLHVSVSMVEKYIAQAVSHCRSTMEQ